MRYGSDWPVTASVYHPTPEPNMFSSDGFFTAAGGVYQSLVRRLWCRWFILNKLLSPKQYTEHPVLGVGGTVKCCRIGILRQGPSQEL